MKFAFTDDQRLFQDAVREFLTKECPPESVHAAWSAVDGWSPDRWKGLAEMGVVGLMLPEAHGGMGLDELDAVLLVEEAGRFGLPEPLVDTSLVAGPLLAAVADEATIAQWLPGVSSGEVVLAVQKGSGGYLTDAHLASLAILVADDEVHAVPTEQLRLQPQSSVDGSRRPYAVDWNRKPDTLIASGPAGWQAVNRAFNRGALGTAAELVGLADRMLELTVDYVKQRHQFGVPVGSFQAIKHQLANVLLKLEFARPVVYRAAYSMAHNSPDRSRDVSMAKLYAVEAAKLASSTALQCHGAIGYTVEYDLHLYMKRTWALEATWGTPRWHRERVAAAVVDRVGGSVRRQGAPAAVKPRDTDEDSIPLGETLG
jgi:alkylation response protein AidB-like acyl-CoA dehydrogenase